MGLPIALLFLARHATVTIAHSKTPPAELQGAFMLGWVVLWMWLL